MSKVPLWAFIAVTLLLEMCVSWFLESKTASFWVISSFLIIGAFDFGRAWLSLKFCKIDDANLSFCFVMLVAASICALITILTGVVSAYHTILGDAVFSSVFWGVYNWFYDIYPDLMKTLTIVELLAIIKSGKHDFGRTITNSIGAVFAGSRGGIAEAYRNRKVAN